MQHIFASCSLPSRLMFAITNNQQTASIIKFQLQAPNILLLLPIHKTQPTTYNNGEKIQTN